MFALINTRSGYSQSATTSAASHLLKRFQESDKNEDEAVLECISALAVVEHTFRLHSISRTVEHTFRLHCINWVVYVVTTKLDYGSLKAAQLNQQLVNWPIYPTGI